MESEFSGHLSNEFHPATFSGMAVTRGNNNSIDRGWLSMHQYGAKTQHEHCTFEDHLVNAGELESGVACTHRLLSWHAWISSSPDQIMIIFLSRKLPREAKDIVQSLCLGDVTE